MRRPRLSLLVGLACAAIAALPALAAKDSPAPRRERRFAHAAHADKMRAAGKGTEGCAGKCHRVEGNGRWSQTGKREHARCFECHKFETSCDTLARGAGKVCVTCHQNLKDACVPRGTPRLAGRPAEFAAAFSHKTHAKPGSNAQQCEGCHGEFGKAAPRTGAKLDGHALCSDCHASRSQPRMNQCAGCHSADGGGTAGMAAGRRPANPFAVTGAFDHVKHAQKDRVGTGGKECLACHGNIASAADGSIMPMPTMQGCYAMCHNGRNAFSVVSNTCTRCHQGGRR